MIAANSDTYTYIVYDREREREREEVIDEGLSMEVSKGLYVLLMIDSLC